ncbi:hypothetical protein C8A05DRAFT_13112 [Staphylotrichum tortipilum]|uniref:F-box domain-containing protein n=1 Tax=Staphylotrichum tortipilum TaxID=2831512 RepID=A0AAN6RW04_9PEZI|nr:hypothetical protein C8A05DRAFT_13112 [Staphylotrichum longicolle]
MTSTLESFFRALVRRRPRVIKHKPIRVQTHNEPSLAELSQELLDLIAEYLHGIDPRSVNSLALVCSALHQSARNIQYRDMSIDISSCTSNSNPAVDRMDSMVRNGLLPVIRTLRIRPSWDLKRSLRSLNSGSQSSSIPKRQDAEIAGWDQVCDLVPRMTGLRDLHWDSEVIPDRLLAHLGKTPRVRWHLSIVDLNGAILRFSEKGNFLRQLPARLAGTQGFSSLRLGVVYGSDLACQAMVSDYLRPLLFSSPRLRALSLNIGPPTSGCTAGDRAGRYSGFGLSPGDTLSPLEELEMIAYPWGVLPTSGVPPGGWPFDTGGYPDVFIPEMHNWARLLDWSRLRRLSLHFDCAELAAHLAPYLTALEHLEFGGDLHQSIRLAIPALLAGLRTRSLKSVILPSFPDPDTWAYRGVPLPKTPFIPFVIAHAATLHTLSLHREPISPANLALLTTALPNLSALTLCLARDLDAWPCDALALIAAFSALSDLTLWFTLGEGRLEKPFLNYSAAETIFGMLCESGAARLRRLRLNSGFPPKPRQGFYIPDEPEWPEGRMTTGFDVGGDAGEGVVVRCVKLGWEGNERLRRVARGEGGMTVKEGRELEFVVALRGPMGYDEWLDWRRPRGGV